MFTDSANPVIIAAGDTQTVAVDGGCIPLMLLAESFGFAPSAADRLSVGEPAEQTIPVNHGRASLRDMFYYSRKNGIGQPSDEQKGHAG